MIMKWRKSQTMRTVMIMNNGCAKGLLGAKEPQLYGITSTIIMKWKKSQMMKTVMHDE